MVVRKDPDMFWTWVQKRMDDLEIPSIRDLEKKAGVSNGAISTRKNQLKMPTRTMAEGLCRALRVTWIELWVKAGYIPPGALDTHITPEERQLVILYRNLSPNRREAALSMINGLRRGYTFAPTKKGYPATCVVQDILALHDQGRRREAVLKLLGSAPTERQDDAQQVLDLLDLIIKESDRRAQQQEAEIEIKQGGRTT